MLYRRQKVFKIYVEKESGMFVMNIKNNDIGIFKIQIQSI